MRILYEFNDVFILTPDVNCNPYTYVHEGNVYSMVDWGDNMVERKEMMHILLSYIDLDPAMFYSAEIRKV